MRDKEIVGLWEAYLQVHQPKEEVEQLDEDFQGAVERTLAAGAKATDKFIKTNPVGRAIGAVLSAGPGRKTPTKASGGYRPVVKSTVGEETDLFDIIKGHLLDEGFADTEEAALAIMTNMSEEWREEILDEAVRGSGRSIADRITGNDIRGVTRKGKTVYKKPKWKDDVENKVDREYRGYALRRQGETENMNDRRDRERIKANKKSINRMNAAKNIEVKQADGDYENSIDHSKPYGKGKSGYMEVPTDYRARKRRASGR